MTEHGLAPLRLLRLQYPARRVRELAATPGVFICRDGARSAATHGARRARR